jgi:1-acyl-sn-glycerol-3-phosphate acyltransferase
MNFHDIDKWSFGYFITKLYTKFAHNLIFYRKVVVTGREYLPEKTPLFFAPNHQNALMDALAIIHNIKAQPVFIARADIFKNPIIAKILVFLKILPAYRIRDGKENLGKNDEIFEIAVQILENKNIITLFPETTHTNLRQLRVLKKGVQRIVFQAEEKNQFKLGAKVVPIGLYFSNYWNFKSDLLVNFGKPIDLEPYNKEYQSNPQKAMLLLRDRMDEEIKKLIIHIPSKQYYPLYEFLRQFYTNKMLSVLSLKKTFYNRFLADQKMISAVDKFENQEPENINTLNNLYENYANFLNKYNIRHWVIERNATYFELIYKTLAIILLSPVFLYGFINNFIPWYLPKPIRNKIKDRQFLSSINYVFGLVLFPLFYLAQFALVWVFTEIWWIKFTYLLSLPFTGVAAFYIHRFFIKLKSQWKYKTMVNAHEKRSIGSLKSEIMQVMDKIIATYHK